MKIDNITSSTNGNLNTLGNLRNTKPNPGVSEASFSSRVKLSGQALDAHTSTESFDSAKVEQIKAAIAEGRFQVNANAVADSLLQTARDLVLAQSRTA